MRRLLLLLALVGSPAAAQVTGNWLTQDKSAIVAVTPCGPSICGSVARILVKKPGMPTTDVKNPNPKLRAKPLVGLRILSGFTGNGKRWENGRIYDPESGKTYKSKLKLNADGSLGVSGCIAIFCKTQRWTRAR